MTHDPDALSHFDPLDHSASHQGCAESQLFMRRRDVLGLSVGLFSWAAVPRIASAASTDRSPKRLLIVLLRGGLDGLNVVPPANQSGYATARGTLKLDLDKQITLQGAPNFKLNAVMPSFGAMFNSGKARIVLPIAPPLRTRSHFDCSFNLENGTFNSAQSKDGWLNRLFGKLSQERQQYYGSRPLQIGKTPVLLIGDQPVISWNPLIYQPDFFKLTKVPAQSSLMELYRSIDPAPRSGPALGPAAKAPDLSKMLDIGLSTDAFSCALGGSSKIEHAFSGAAKLMAAGDGPRISVLTVDNFDTHIRANENTVDVLAKLDKGLGLFQTDTTKSGIWNSSLVVCVSEFGRTVTDNAQNGSDHGIGGVALLAGGAINSSAVIGSWPNISDKTQLADNMDVPAKYDTRDLFRTILTEHMGITGSFLTTDIFPGLDSPPRDYSFTQVAAEGTRLLG